MNTMLIKTSAAALVLVGAFMAASGAEATGCKKDCGPQKPAHVTVDVDNTVKNHTDVNNTNTNKTNVNIGNVSGGAGGAGGKGGNADANAHATGGNAHATGGDSLSQSSSGSTANNSFRFTQRAAAYAPAAIVQPSGNCGSGWAMSLGTLTATGGVARTAQDQTCLATNAALMMVEQGLLRADKGVAAIGIATLNELYTEFGAAQEIVAANLVKRCWKEAGERSAVLLADKNLDCAAVERTRVRVAFIEAKRQRPRAHRVPAGTPTLPQICVPVTEQLKAALCPAR